MNEKIIFLGTGNATVTKCYNTCFAFEFSKEDYFLVDTGGGNGILTQLEKADISLEKIHNIFISHEHTDHLLGIVWLIRMIATKMKKGLYDGNLNIYCHKNLKDVILTISKLTIQKKFFDMIGQRIFINIVKDEDELNICNHDFTFFDIRSSKAEQYGFKMVLDNKKVLVFCGDEPYQPHEEKYAFNCDYLLHEAFCKYTDREIFLPYEKSHTTVKEASENATNLNAKTLILYHTEDKNLPERKYLYSSEAKAYFSGTVIVPDDLDIINL